MTDRHPAAHGDDPRADPVYRWVRALMAIDMLVGAAFAIYGLATGQSAFVAVGFGLAAIGAVLFLFFAVLAKRRAQAGGSSDGA